MALLGVAGGSGTRDMFAMASLSATLVGQTAQGPGISKAGAVCEYMSLVLSLLVGVWVQATRAGAGRGRLGGGVEALDTVDMQEELDSLLSICATDLSTPMGASSACSKGASGCTAPGSTCTASTGGTQHAAQCSRIINTCTLRVRSVWDKILSARGVLKVAKSIKDRSCKDATPLTRRRNWDSAIARGHEQESSMETNIT